MDHVELLRHALAIDKRLKETKQPPKPVTAKPYNPPALVAPDDPFGGNENNRRVAEAVAKEKAELTGESSAEPVTVQPAKPAKTSKAAKADPKLVWKPNA